MNIGKINAKYPVFKANNSIIKGHCGKSIIALNDSFSEQYGFFNNNHLQHLYDLKKYDEIINSVSQKKFSVIYSAIKDNEDFKELINTDCFSQLKGFFKLLDIMDKLKLQRAEKTKKPLELCYPLPTDYSVYDIPDYLKFLNNLVKSDAPKELKQLYIDTKCSDIRVYYGILNNIENVKDVSALLLKRQHFKS